MGHLSFGEHKGHQGSQSKGRFPCPTPEAGVRGPVSEAQGSATVWGSSGTEMEEAMAGWFLLSSVRHPFPTQACAVTPQLAQPLTVFNSQGLFWWYVAHFPHGEWQEVERGPCCALKPPPCLLFSTYMAFSVILALAVRWDSVLCPFLYVLVHLYLGPVPSVLWLIQLVLSAWCSVFMSRAQGSVTSA